VNFGGGNLTSAGNDDIFVAKLNPDGNWVWSKSFGDGSYQEATSVAIDVTETPGNVIVAGGFQGSVNFGGGALTSLGGYDMCIAKFSPGGAHLWSKRFGDAETYQFAQDVAADAAGNAIMTGYFRGGVDFGGGTLGSAGDYDMFIAKFSPGGAHVWSKRFGDAVSQSLYSVAADKAGNVVVAGFFDGTVDFGGGPLTSEGNSDACVAKFAPGGAHAWSKRFGDAAGDQGVYCVATDASGNVLLTGPFEQTVDFGGGTLTSEGSLDVFVVKIGP
jgi:hypothetical protein